MFVFVSFCFYDFNLSHLHLHTTSSVGSVSQRLQTWPLRILLPSTPLYFLDPSHLISNCFHLFPVVSPYLNYPLSPFSLRSIAVFSLTTKPLYYLCFLGFDPVATCVCTLLLTGIPVGVDLIVFLFDLDSGLHLGFVLCGLLIKHTFIFTLPPTCLHDMTRITQNSPKQFPWHFMAGCSEGQGRTH